MSMRAMRRRLRGELTFTRLSENPSSGLNDAGNIAAERQEDVQPELQADADLQEHADRRQKNGKKNTHDVQDGLQKGSTIEPW